MFEIRFECSSECVKEKKHRAMLDVADSYTEDSSQIQPLVGSEIVLLCSSR